MPPRSPLPQVRGLDAARLRTPTRIGAAPPQWGTMQQWLVEKLPAKVPVQQMVEQGAFVYQDGTAVAPSDPFRHQTFLWFYREPEPEPEVPGDIHIVYRDERILVVDKPPFLATTPRGRHARQSVLVRLRDELGLSELAPMHRLDRSTSGLLALTVERRWRGAYQTLFDKGAVEKRYWALAPLNPNLDFPLAVSNHLEKERGRLQVRVAPDKPANSRTFVELETKVGDRGLYRLTPETGRTHQLRAHMNYLGIPIENDPLYPRVLDVAPDDFGNPLQLLAGELSFLDPVDSIRRRFFSKRRLGDLES